MSDDIDIGPVSLADLSTIAALEAAGYPPTEAATSAQFELRIREAGDYFRSARLRESGELIGYVCGTLVRGDELTAESMRRHEADGATLCIHSVCVAAAWRHRGIASRLLTALVEEVRARRPQPIKRIALIAHGYLLPLYEGVGFRNVGPSPVAHGPNPWFSCIMDLDTGE